MSKEWTAEMSHVRFQEIQSKIADQFDQALDPYWVANFIDQLVDNELGLYNQVPCDTCENNYNNACLETNCPNM